jgi:hypothetical protein
MQNLKGLTTKDFKTKGVIIFGRLEIDQHGINDWREVKEVVDFNVSSSLVNLLQRTYALSFSARILNTKDKYSLFDPRADKYKHIRQGKRVRLYLGIKKGNRYEWNWFYGIIDKASFSYDANSEICDITGRDYIAYLQENYLKNLFWGKYYSFSIIPFQEKYSMPSNCKGIYQAWHGYYLGEYRNEQLTLNSQYTYDWEYNHFVWLHPSVPAETGSVYLYYLTPQKIKDVVADLLEEAGLLATSFKQEWKSNSKYMNISDKIIDRVYFQKGTNYLDAINLLSEVALARFYINPDGIPCFRQIPVVYVQSALRLNEYMIRNIEERLDELYNHFLIEGEKRVMKRINLGAYTEGCDMEYDQDAKKYKATIYGFISADGLSSAEDVNPYSILTEKGFKWREAEGTENKVFFYSGSMEMFNSTLTLNPDSFYEWKSYAKNQFGHYIESNWNSIKTKGEEQ